MSDNSNFSYITNLINNKIPIRKNISPTLPDKNYIELYYEDIGMELISILNDYNLNNSTIFSKELKDFIIKYILLIYENKIIIVDQRDDYDE